MGVINIEIKVNDRPQRKSTRQLSKILKEDLVEQGFRNGDLCLEEVADNLGLQVAETQQWLKQRGVVWEDPDDAFQAILDFKPIRGTRPVVDVLREIRENE